MIAGSVSRPGKGARPTTVQAFLQVDASEKRLRKGRHEWAYSQTVIRVMYRSLLTKIEGRRHYLKLFVFLLFVGWYLAMLCLQREANVGYQVHSTVASVLIPRDSSTQTREVFWDWLDETVQSVWKDPICGDGLCKAPWEFASYSSFGCRADCGLMPVTQNLTSVQIDLYWDFTHPTYSIPTVALMAQARWNLCPKKTSYASSCYFNTLGDNTFERPKGSSLTIIEDAPDGEWNLRIVRDGFNKISGAVRSVRELNNAASYYKIFIAAYSAMAENAYEATLLRSAANTGRESLWDYINKTIRGTRTDAQADYDLQQLINATCMCDVVQILGDASGKTWGNRVFEVFNGTADIINKPALSNIANVVEYKTTYCSALGASMPVLHRQVLVNETTAGVRFFGPVPITNPVTNYTTFNVSLPVTDSNSKSNLVSMCNTLMTNMSAHKIAMNTTMLRLLVDQRNGADKRFLKVQSNLLMDAIAALLPELLTPIFVSPLGELPLSDPHSASLTALQALYEPGITFATQPGSATLNLARPNVISVSLQGFPSMSLLADARLAEMAFQEGEVNSTTIQAPAFADSYPVLTVKEILDLYESAGATSGILPHPSSTSMGVLATDYNLATWDGNTTAYTDCDLAVRAPEYLGSCTSKNVTCNVSSDASSQPFNCTQLPGGETVVGDLSVASNRTVCEQPCEMELDCAALCNCFDSCSSAEVCVCSACLDLRLDAAADTEFADIIYNALEAGQSPSQISGLQTTSAGRRQLSSSGSRRNLLQINLQDELDNAANQFSEVKNVQDGLSTELVTMDSDVRASNVESVRLARDDTMAALIKASQRDLNLGQATVISRLDEIIDQQDVALAAAQEVAAAIAQVNELSEKFADATMALRTSIQEKILAIGVAVRDSIATLGQALALWKRVRRDRAVTEKESKLANSPCNLRPLRENAFNLSRAGVDVVLTPRERDVGTKNRLVAGMLLHQTRIGPSTCLDSKFAVNFNSNCVGEATTSPFGVDPIFNTNANLFDANAQDPNDLILLGKYDCYDLPNRIFDTVDGNRTTNLPPYCSDLFNKYNLPYAFHHHPLEGKEDGYPVFLDINLGAQEAAGMVKYLKEARYIDGLTKAVTAEMVTYNPPLHLFSYAYVKFDVLEGGSVKLHHKLQTVRVDLYHFSKDTVRFILEIGTSGMVVCMLMWSLLTLVTTCAKQGFSTWFTARNVFSLSCDLLTVSTMVYWWIIVYLYANMYNIDLRYDVYNNIGPYARALELANGGRGIEDVSAAFSELESLSDHFAWYISLNSISILLLIARLHILIAFQAQLGLISRTLVAAASDLAHFVGVALVILFLLAAMAHVVFGASMDAFNSMDYSIRTCFEMLLGNTDANAELQDENSPLYRIGAIFFWVFNLLVVLVLVSFLIAIICDAFAKVQAQDDDNTSIFTDLRMILSDNWRALRSMLSSGRRIKEAELVQFLSEMCDLGDPKQHDDLASSRRSSRMSSYSGVVKNKVVPAPPLVSVAVAEQDENAVIAFVEPAATFPKQQNTAGVVAEGVEEEKDVVPFSQVQRQIGQEKKDWNQVVMVGCDGQELSQEQLLRELKKAMDLVLKGQASQTSSPGSHTIWGGNKARRSNKDKDKDKGALSGYFSGRLSSSSNAPSEEEGGHAPIDQSQDPSVVARTLLERWGAKRGDGSKDEETWEEPNHELLTFLNGEGRREQRALEEECKVLEAALMTLYASQRQLYDGQKELVESQLKVHEQQSLLRHLAPVDVAPRKNRPLDKGKTSVPIPTLEPKVPGSAGSRLGSPGKSMPMPDRLSVSGGGSSP